MVSDKLNRYMACSVRTVITAVYFWPIAPSDTMINYCCYLSNSCISNPN